MKSFCRLLLGFAVILVLTVQVTLSSASEVLRVYTVKNVATEVDTLRKEFCSRNPDIGLLVTGGVPESGFASFASGNQDIMICPQDQLDRAKLSLGTDFQLAKAPVGRYGMAVVVNSDLPIKELTTAQAAKVFTGEYTNWKQLGGPNEPIKVYTREPNAGATVYMKHNLLGKSDFTAAATPLARDEEIIRQISQFSGAVGYVRVNRIAGTGLQAIALKKEENSPGIMPTEETVKSGSYPLTVVLTAYWNNLSKKSSSIQAFVNLCKENQLGLLNTPGVRLFTESALNLSGRVLGGGVGKTSLDN